MGTHVTFTKHGQIAVLTADNPPVNALGHAVRAGIVAGIRQAEADQDVKAIVLICAGRTFFAGADIREFGKPQQSPSLRDVHEVMSACPKLIVSAIHGTALGGGFETALASHYRVAVPSSKVGTPEVNLGILPGAGGTQRLPRLVGVEAALDLVVGGRPIGAKKALSLGAIDKLIDGDLNDGAIAFTKALLAQGAALRKVADMAVGDYPVDAFDKMRAQMAKQKRGFAAPQRCIDAVEAAVTLPFDQGMKRERELFDQCMANPQAGAQRYAFFAEREVANVPGITKDIKVRTIARVGVIGAGTMGGGIAMCFANAGIPVTVVEAKGDALDRGLGVVRRNYEISASRGRMTVADVDKRMALITGSLEYAALKDADMIIEAVFEDMALKKKIFAQLDQVAKPGAILASNTSTLDVDEIAAATKRPGDVIGTHFFSPANVMRLLEIVRGKATSPDVLATTLNVSKAIGKVGVVSGVCFGFIGNRMLFQYGREAEVLILEGATPTEVDKALYDFGLAMGPFAMNDMAGLDVGALVRREHRAHLPDDPAYCVISDKLAAMGRLGQKTGRGYYLYAEGSRTPEPDGEVLKIIEAEAARLGIKRRTVTAEEIVARCLYAMINEGALILEEGIALRPADIDTVWLNGYGFPAYRGGPMYYADQVGISNIAEAIGGYRAQYGEAYWPHAPLLEKLAAAGKGFAQWQDVM